MFAVVTLVFTYDMFCNKGTRNYISTRSSTITVIENASHNISISKLAEFEFVTAIFENVKKNFKIKGFNLSDFILKNYNIKLVDKVYNNTKEG